MQNGKLNTSQRQALEKLVQNTFNRRIQEQRDAYNDSVSRVTKEVKDELGITAIDDQLREIKQKITDLESEKERLGISKYNDSFLSGSKTKEIVEEKTLKEKQDIRELESQMDKTITAIWTAEELSEIKDIVDGIVK
jgi:hypothetical protein